MIMGTANQEQHPASAIKKPTDFSIDAIMRKDDTAATAADSRHNIMFGECQNIFVYNKSTRLINGYNIMQVCFMFFSALQILDLD